MQKIEEDFELLLLMTDASQIISETLRGNQGPLKEVYRAYRREFVSWAYSQFKLPEDEATEAFQFAVVTFYENVMGGKLVHLTSSLKTYLFAIGKNKAQEFLRRKSRHDDVTNLNIEEPADDLPQEDEAEQRRRVERMTSSMDKLGMPCSQILILYYYQQASLTDIAMKMGYKNMDSLKSQKFKCMERLRTIYFNK